MQARAVVECAHEAVVDRLTKHLTDELLPFWVRFGIDRQHGGFFNEIDHDGTIVDAGVRYGAMQARLVLSFCYAYEVVPREEYAAMARHGLAFLIARFWDDEAGGWRERIDLHGGPASDRKHLFTNAYALLALAEAARVLCSDEAHAYAVRTYDLLDRHAWDDRHAGYVEHCAGDWSLTCGEKTACVTLDMLAAVMALSGISSDARHAERARQLADLACERLFDARHGCVLERFTPNWTYQPLPSRNEVWTGHNLKAASLLLEITQRHDRPDDRAVARTLIDFCLREGWDSAHGGLFQRVYRTGGVACEEKLWWPQCEGLEALWRLHDVSDDPVYRARFHELLTFALSSFPDREVGEWVTACRADGTPFDSRKAHAYKTAFHPVRMCHAVVKRAIAHPHRPGRFTAMEHR